MKKVMICFVGLSAAMMSCSDDDERKARLEIRLTDAPGDFEAVNIDIQGIEIKATDDSNESGWKQIDVNTGVYNLLELTNGIDTLLSSTDIPAGRI